MEYDRALRFDLSSEVGLRVLVNSSGENQTIGFVVHHACVDGMGAFQFMQDVAIAYGMCENQANEAEPIQPEIAVKYLRKYRDSNGGNRLLHFLRWPFDLLAMVSALEMLVNRPKPIELANGGQRIVDQIVDGFESDLKTTETIEMLLTDNETKRAKRNGKANGQTLNDRVVESVFLAIEDWNKAHNPPNAGSLIRLMVPMNLRQAPVVSAANMVAMVNLDRRVGRWKSLVKFRQWLKREMNLIKFTRSGVTANRFLKLQKLMFGRWPMQETSNPCLATCLVSNFGDIFRAFRSDAVRASDNRLRFGELPIVSFRTVTPLRSGSNVFIGLFSYAGQLSFNVTYNSRVLERHHVEHLMDSVKRHLLQSS